MDDLPMGAGGDGPPDDAVVSAREPIVRTKALDAEERRLDLLEAAARLAALPDFAEQDWLSPVRRITLHDVAESLGKSRTWAYRLWSTRDEFWRDLAIQVSMRPDTAVRALVSRPWSSATEPGADAVAWLARCVATSATDGSGRAESACRIAISGHRPPPIVVEANRVRRVDALAQLTAWVENWLEGAGLRLRDDIAVTEFAESLYVLVCGGRTAMSFQRHLVDPSVWRATLETTVVRLVGAVCEPALGAARTDPGASTPTGAATALPSWTPSQRDVLDRAYERLVADGPDSPAARISALGTLTVARLARYARVHRSTVYRFWPNEDALKLDLLVHITARRVDEAVERLHRLTHDTRVEPMRRAADFAIWASRQLYEAEPTVSMMFAADLDHPSVVAALRARYDDMLPRDEGGVAGESEDERARFAAALGLVVWYGGRELSPSPGDETALEHSRFAVALLVAALGLNGPGGAPTPVGIAELRTFTHAPAG